MNNDYDIMFYRPKIEYKKHKEEYKEFKIEEEFKYKDIYNQYIINSPSYVVDNIKDLINNINYKLEDIKTSSSDKKVEVFDKDNINIKNDITFLLNIEKEHFYKLKNYYIKNYFGDINNEDKISENFQKVKNRIEYSEQNNIFNVNYTGMFVDTCLSKTINNYIDISNLYINKLTDLNTKSQGIKDGLEKIFMSETDNLKTYLNEYLNIIANDNIIKIVSNIISTRQELIENTILKEKYFFEGDTYSIICDKKDESFIDFKNNIINLNKFVICSCNYKDDFLEKLKKRELLLNL